MDTQNQQRNRVRLWLRRAALIVGLVLAVSAARYVLTRLLADRNAIRVYVAGTRTPALTNRFEGTLRFASFNIAHGRGTNASNWSDRSEREARLKQIADLLKRERVDIAVLNEVDFDSVWSGHQDQARVIAREAGFEHVMEQRNFNVAFPFYRVRSGNAILSHFPIKSAQFVKLPPRADWENRVAGSKHGSFADLQLDDKTTIRLFAVHLEWRDEPTRGRSGDVLLACAADSPVPFFCIGDFNCTPTFAKTKPGAVETSTLDTLLNSGRLKTIDPAPLTPDQLTFSSFAPTAAIDWVLVPPDWEFVSQRVLDIQLSDHRPVFAEVRRR